MSDSVAIAVHEAAHVLASLASGFAPLSVHIDRGGGRVSLPDAMPPEVAAIVAVAGYVGETLLLDSYADMSAPDVEIVRDAAREIGTCEVALTRWAMSRASEMLGSREAELLEIANVLLSRGSLDHDQLRDAMRPRSCLSQYRGLFKPAAKSTRETSSDRGGFLMKSVEPLWMTATSGRWTTSQIDSLLRDIR